MTLQNNELALLKRYQSLLADAYVRGVVLISGERAWVEQFGANWLAALGSDGLWIGDAAPSHSQQDTAANARRYLGQDYNVIVMNCYSGFHPDGFGALCGSLVGGGMLVLLTPELDPWASYADPDYQRMTAHNTAVTSDNFIRRIISKFNANPYVWHIRQGVLLVNYPQIDLPTFTPANTFTLTSDQQQALAAIKKVVNGRANRPLVMTSDRGRGKSTVLGVAAAELLTQNVDAIAVCAPSITAVNALFSYAQSQLNGFWTEGNSLTNGTKRLFFLLPYELLNDQSSIDVVLVDEAAALPADILKQLVLRHSRIVFASTVHGYEGNGRGFAIRFQHSLDELRPQWRRVFLQQSVRWAAADFLEPLVAELLLLNADAAVVTKSCERARRHIQWISGADLCADEIKLTQLFGLLVQAHYRTSPDDLRLLLDGPNIHIAVVVDDGAIVAAVLIAAEGKLEQALHSEVARGNRRVSGHLVPQVLASQAGVQTILQYACWRVMRIAVHPDLRRSGIGSMLLEWVFSEAKTQQIDYLATSFAITGDVLAFWQRNNFDLLHIGWRLDSVSGAFNAVMLRPISSAVGNLCNAQMLRLQTQFSVLLASNFNDLAADIAVCIIKNITTKGVSFNLSQDDKRDIELFVSYQRQYETCISALNNAALILVANLSDPKLCRLVAVKVLQHKSWQQTASLCGYKGRAEVICELKKVYNMFLQSI